MRTLAIDDMQSVRDQPISLEARLPVKNYPRIVFSYPGLMPHAVNAARALYEAGGLVRFDTSFAYSPESTLGRWVRFLLQLGVGDRADAELRRRTVDGIPWSAIRLHPTLELLRTAIVRAKGSPILADRVWEQSVFWFDRQVAAQLNEDLDGVTGFEYTCRFTFERARRLGIRTFYHMAAPHYRYSERVIGRELDKFSSLQTPYQQHLKSQAERRAARRTAEHHAADTIVANSSFTARTLIDTGFDPTRVVVLPLAAPPLVPQLDREQRRSEITVLCAGALAIHKGTHYLLDAWTRVRSTRTRLLLVGGWQLPASMRKSLPPNVEWLGPMPRSELSRIMQRADVVVFPSLGDGFGMVVAEALSHGVPVIATTTTGASDLITEGESGFIIPPANAEAIATRLEWCFSHPIELVQMREPARQAAASRQWVDYRREYAMMVAARCGSIPSHLAQPFLYPRRQTEQTPNRQGEGPWPRSLLDKKRGPQ